MNSTKFIHFGCWNQGICNKEDNDNNKPITKVMRQLDRTLLKNKHDFIIIAGDNYYPQKKDKEKGTDALTKTKSKTEKKIKAGKTIIKADLKSGFDCLPNDIEINIILGNHDLETTTTENKLFIENEESPEETGECSIIKYEQEYVKKTTLMTIDLYKHKWLGNNTLILFIDTSMYDLNDAPLFLPCYNIKTGKKYMDIAELYTEQQAFVNKMITKYSSGNRMKNLIIIGHHPISGYKKKGGSNLLIQSFPGLIQLLSSIPSKIPFNKYINYYYLCADLHLYQAGTITLNNNENIMRIRQYIVGTGGTKLDDSPFLNDMPLPEDNVSYADEFTTVSYEMTQEQIELSTSEKYGFLECELIKGKMYFKFIDTAGKKYKEKISFVSPVLLSKRTKGKGKGTSFTRKIKSI